MNICTNARKTAENKGGKRKQVKRPKKALRRNSLGLFP